jgi:hypothetical protein
MTVDQASRAGQSWMYDADGNLMKPELDLYHELRLTDEQWRAWFDVVDTEANARSRGRNGVKLQGLAGDPKQPLWVQAVDALTAIGRIDEADGDTALKSEWIKYAGCPGCGSSGAFLRRDPSKPYESGQVRLSCGRKCRTRDVLTALQIDTTPKVTVLDVPTPPTGPFHTPSVESAESAESRAWEGFGFLSWDDLEALDIPEPEWLVPHLIPVGGMTLLVGPPKSCKTFAAIAVAASVSTLSPTLSTPVTTSDLHFQHFPHFPNGERGFEAAKRGAVLFFSPDDPNEGRFRKRVRMVTGAEKPRHLHVTFTQNPGFGATFADRLIAELDSRNREAVAESAENPAVRLVVIDTLQRVKSRGTGGDRYADDVAALVQLRRVCVAHPDVTILVLHHSRKADPRRDADPLELVSGTQGLAGGVDHVLILQVPSDRGPARTLHVMGRDGEDHKLALTMTGSGLVFVDEDPEDPARLMGAGQGAVYRVLREFPNGAEVKEVAEATGLPPKDVAGRLGRLVDSGHALRLERGVYRAAEWTGDAR